MFSIVKRSHKTGIRPHTNRYISMIYEFIRHKNKNQTVCIHNPFHASWHKSAAQNPRAPGPACYKSAPYLSDCFSFFFYLVWDSFFCGRGLPAPLRCYHSGSCIHPTAPCCWPHLVFFSAKANPSKIMKSPRAFPSGEPATPQRRYAHGEWWAFIRVVFLSSDHAVLVGSIGNSYYWLS